MQTTAASLIRRVLNRIRGRSVPQKVPPRDDFGFTPLAEGEVTAHLAATFAGPSLRQLFAFYGSDKGHEGLSPRPYPWPPHNYAAVYEFLFRSRRHSVRVLLECGIGSNNTDVASNMTESGRPGASLRAWRDYFPNARILGLDIDERILFEEERIRTFCVDQTDASSVNNFWSSNGSEPIDIIIDDGLHTFDAGTAFFESSFEWLQPGGIYVIEDVDPDDLKRFVNYFRGKDVFVSYFQLHRPGVRLGNNTLVVVQKSS